MMSINQTLSKKSLMRHSSIVWENLCQLVCRRHIDLFTSEWVTHLHILPHSNSHFYTSRIHDLKQYRTHMDNNVKEGCNLHLLSRAWEKTDYKTNMAIRINRNKKVPYQCEKDLWWSHNHSVDCFHLTSSCPLLPATRDKFCTYFEKGLSASEAFHHHETQLMKDPVTLMLLADHKYVLLYVV